MSPFTYALADMLQVPDVQGYYGMIDRGGVVALLFLSVVFVSAAFIFRWVVPGATHQDVVQERDALRDTLKGLSEGIKAVADEVRELRRIEPTRRSR